MNGAGRDDARPGGGNGGSGAGRRLIAGAVAARRRADLVAGLRGLARPQATPGGAAPRLESTAMPGAAGPGAATPRAAAPGPAVPAGDEQCDLCGVSIGPEHRHLLHLAERRIACACEACWAMRAGEGDYRPTGNRTLWLPELRLPDDVWAGFQIPIGLAFFMRSTVTESVVAMYPSPAGATESELRFESWGRFVALNPVLGELEPDIEGLIVNRLADPPAYAIAPIDRCYALTGAIKAGWEGISGGSGVERAVAAFFAQLQAEAARAPRGVAVG